MKLQEIYIKYKSVIWPVVVSISSVVILVLVIIPSLREYLSVKSQISDIQKRSFILDAKASELIHIDDEATRQNLQVVFTILPTDQDIPMALNVLQNQIAKAGLELKNTNFAGVKQSGKNSFQLNVTVSGQLSALRNWLINFSDAPRLFQIEAINVQFQKDRLRLEAEVPISVFYQTQPATIGSLDQPIPKLSDAEQQTLAKLAGIVTRINRDLGTIEATTSSVPLGKSNPFE